MRAFKDYIALVERMKSEQLNRNENDISSNLANALATFGLRPVLDTGGGANHSKRPDIMLYTDLPAADVAAAADILLECKKPSELAKFSSLEDALVNNEIWEEKFAPYLRAHCERVVYFILTTFERFSMVPIDSNLRSGIQDRLSYPDVTSRRSVLTSATMIDLRSIEGSDALEDWCKNHLSPEVLRPPVLSSIIDLRCLSSQDDLEMFASALADVVIGPEDRPTPGGALVSSIKLKAERLEQLPAEARSALIIYTMSVNGGMSIDDAQRNLTSNFQGELAEFISASIHSLVGRLFAVKTMEDAFCIEVDPPLVETERWVFHSTRFDMVEQARLPEAFFAALSSLSSSSNSAVRDLAATGRFYDWIAKQVDPAAFRRLLALFYAYNFRDLDGDLLGRFFEIYAQRIDRRRRRELGQYYTPAVIVKCMWRLSLTIARERKALDQLLVLDPAVGSGTFLVEGARQLAALGVQSFWKKLNGFDIAPQVIGVAQVNLYLAVLGLLDRTQAEAVGSLNLYPTDALDPRNGAKFHSLMTLLTDEKVIAFLMRRIAMSEEVKRSARFPIVIGNPPYKHNSTRTLGQMAEIFPALLRSSRANARARQNTIREDYAWFFAAADHYLADSGLIAFVVSDSFCYARSFRFFRADLLRRYRIRHLIHLGRFIFRDVGPRTSFVIVVLERRESELMRPDETEAIPYVDIRPLAVGAEAARGSPDDPRLLAMAANTMPAASKHYPSPARSFAFFPASEAVALVMRAPIVIAEAPRRVFVKKWPGAVTGFDKLFKARNRSALETKIQKLFQAASESAQRREELLAALANEIRVSDDDETSKLARLAGQIAQEKLTFDWANIRRTVTGSAPNDAAWYPDARMTAWVYYESRFLFERRTNEGRRVGWGSSNQWRTPASHCISPKLVFTTSTNVEAGLKAFVLNNEWIVLKAAGTRQQLNYTGVSNPLVQDHFTGPNNLGSEELQMYNSIVGRGYNEEDFLLYIAGIYNSQLGEDYLEGGGSNMMHIPVDPNVLDPGNCSPPADGRYDAAGKGVSWRVRRMAWRRAIPRRRPVSMTERTSA